MGWTQNDTSPTGTFTCTTDGTAANLTGATVVMHCTRDDGTTFTRTAGGNGLTVTTPASGVVSYTPQVGDLTVAGVYRFELQVTFSGGAVQTFPYTRTYVGPELG